MFYVFTNIKTVAKISNDRPFHFQKRNQLSEIEDQSFSTQDLTSGAVEGIATVIEENDGKKHTTIQLCDGIRPKSFVRVLQFLYTGTTFSINKSTI